MEKRKLSGKTILKLAGALLALVYLGFCLYAGITGKFPSMHRAAHVMRFGDLKNWVSGGISAVMIFAFCITSALNDLNLQKGRMFQRNEYSIALFQFYAYQATDSSD